MPILCGVRLQIRQMPGNLDRALLGLCLRCLFCSSFLPTLLCTACTWAVPTTQKPALCRPGAPSPWSSNQTQTTCKASSMEGRHLPTISLSGQLQTDNSGSICKLAIWWVQDFRKQDSGISLQRTLCLVCFSLEKQL